MKNVREWFNLHSPDTYSEVERSFDNLLSVLREAIYSYFNVSINSNIQDLLKLVEQNCEDNSQKFFLDWLKSEGIEILKSVTSDPLPIKEDLIAQLDYVSYIVGEELDVSYPDELRGAMITAISELQPRIAVFQSESEISSTSSSYEYNFDNHFWDIDNELFKSYLDVFQNSTDSQEGILNKFLIDEWLNLSKLNFEHDEIRLMLYNEFRNISEPLDGAFLVSWEFLIKKEECLIT